MARQASPSSEMIIKRLKSLENPKNIEGMSRFGISAKNTLGISMPALRSLAKEIGKDHALAISLWRSGIHEARILSSLVDDPKLVEEGQADSWVKDFDSWDVCDQVCMNLFAKTPFAPKKVREWSVREEEFVKRASFALIASLSLGSGKATDDELVSFLPLIEAASLDERNFVKKAVNWALRQIGKRDAYLNKKAIACAKKIQGFGSKSARWIANDAIRELESDAVQSRLASMKSDKD